MSKLYNFLQSAKINWFDPRRILNFPSDASFVVFCRSTTCQRNFCNPYYQSKLVSRGNELAKFWYKLPRDDAPLCEALSANEITRWRHKRITLLSKYSALEKLNCLPCYAESNTGTPYFLLYLTPSLDVTYFFNFIQSTCVRQTLYIKLCLTNRVVKRMLHKHSNVNQPYCYCFTSRVHSSADPFWPWGKNWSRVEI